MWVSPRKTRRRAQSQIVSATPEFNWSYRRARSNTKDAQPNGTSASGASQMIRVISRLWRALYPSTAAVTLTTSPSPKAGGPRMSLRGLIVIGLVVLALGGAGYGFWSILTKGEPPPS